MKNMSNAEIGSLGWPWCVRDATGNLVGVSVDRKSAEHDLMKPGYRLINCSKED